jgi:hypothetical protein
MLSADGGVGHCKCLCCTLLQHILTIFCCDAQGTQIVPHIPANANIGQSLGNYKKNYRQVRPSCSPWETFRPPIHLQCLAARPGTLLFTDAQ